MAGRSIRIDLNDEASQKLKDIANALKISEDEVIRQGLLLVGLYTTLDRNKQDALILKKDNKEQELLIQM